MPMLSKNQNAARYAAAAGHSTIGIPQGVGRKFVADSHGQNIKKLPQHKHKKPAKREHVFGSMSPTQSGHYDGDMP